MNAPPSAPRLLAPGTGPALRVLGELLTIKAAAADTGGAYTLFEVRTAPGRGMPPHLQRLDDETLFVLEGTYAIRVADGRVECGPGGYAFVPRGTCHAYTNIGPGPARLLVLVSPGGVHEQFVAELGTPVADPATAPLPGGAPDLGAALAVAPKYDIEFAPPPAE